MEPAISQVLRLVQNAKLKRGLPLLGVKPKRSRYSPSAGQTFRQAEADNLLGVVLVQGHPYTVLSRVQLDRVRERLLQGIEAAVDSGNVSIPCLTKQESDKVGYTYHARTHLLFNGSSQLLPTLLCRLRMIQRRHCVCSL